MKPLDERPLPQAYAPDVRRSTEVAAALRATPAKCLIEGLLAMNESGPQVFDNYVVSKYIRQRFGEDALERYLQKLPCAGELHELAYSSGWKVSPLAAGLKFGSRMMAGETFLAARHLQLISDSIVDAVRGVGPRKIAVSMPFRHGKSQLLSALTPAWYLSNWPSHQVGLCGYSDTFAGTWGRTVRNIITPDLFGFSLAPDAQAAHQFRTEYDGGLWAVGIEGSAQGRGGNLMVVDDPIKNAEEAYSRTYRDKTWMWFMSTALTRLQDAGILLVVMTRWHSDDLVGQLKSGFDGTDPSDWLFLELPAIWEKDTSDLIGRAKGEALWPEKRPLEELISFRGGMSAEAWSSGYQQIPLDESGIGRVYHAFDATRHVQEVERDDRLDVYVGWDFNVDPMSLVLAQIKEAPMDPMRRILTNERPVVVEILDELCLPNSNTADAADELVERLRRWVPRGRKLRVRITGDASGHQRRTTSENLKSDWEQIRACFGRYSNMFSVTYETPRSNPSVRDRVGRVNALLKNAEGTSHFFVDPRCRQLIADLNAVRWARDANGNPRDVLDKKDPARTHSSDAMGYLVANWIGGSREFVGEVAEVMF